MTKFLHGRLPLLSEREAWKDILNALEAHFTGAGPAPYAEIMGEVTDPVDSNFGGDPVAGIAALTPAIGSKQAILGAMYSRLNDGYWEARNPKQCAEVVNWMARVRALSGVPKSEIQPQLNGGLDGMADGVFAPLLSFVPPKRETYGRDVRIGSEPSKTIGAQADIWKILNKRKSPDDGTSYYILGHMINHRLNGPGDVPINLLPISSQTNKKMAKEVEAILKEVVNMGYCVRFDISTGLRVGDRTDLLDQLKADTSISAADRATMQEILEAEANLPQWITINATVVDEDGNPRRHADGTEIQLVSSLDLEVGVPDTLPLL